MAAAQQKVEQLEPPKPKELKPIGLDTLKLFEFQNAVWRVQLPEGMGPEVLEDPALWIVVAGKLRFCDRIEVIGHDCSWWAEALVLSAERGFGVIVKTLRVAEFGQMPKNQYSDLPPGHEIVFDPANNTYQPFRLGSDGRRVPLAEPQRTRELARARLLEHASLRR